ncbi:tail fiber domain-containing protein, partial [Candidatus Acetothermia bacterium]|nr:tail fiber domain-containing protein [Candidatus Acetothermia bacterium]
TAPQEQLHIAKNFRLPPSTATTGIIMSGGDRYIHNFGINNFFAGVNAGNFTMTGAATNNVGVGVQALFNNAAGEHNTAVGEGALFNNITASFNTAVGAGTLVSNTTGGDNTAVGVAALHDNTIAERNTAVGHSALRSNTTGSTNTAVGHSALISNTTGGDNTAVGTDALFTNMSGATNTAVGHSALKKNTTGSNNTAVGLQALYFATGSDNIALGTGAGGNIASFGNNIDIGNDGVSTDGNTIRIGNGTHLATFIAGIYNVNLTVPPPATIRAVCITPSGALGTAPPTAGCIFSSRRFKEHIEDMGAFSEVLYRLRPVSFLYKPEYGGRPDQPQFGLIAEEVAKVAPELVAYDEQGQPYTVNYQFLAPMLVNELQKKDAELKELQARLDALERLVKELQEQVKK